MKLLHYDCHHRTPNTPATHHQMHHVVGGASSAQALVIINVMIVHQVIFSFFNIYIIATTQNQMRARTFSELNWAHKK